MDLLEGMRPTRTAWDRRGAPLPALEDWATDILSHSRVSVARLGVSLYDAANPRRARKLFARDFGLGVEAREHIAVCLLFSA